jgi:hypothetical protein
MIIDAVEDFAIMKSLFLEPFKGGGGGGGSGGGGGGRGGGSRRNAKNAKPRPPFNIAIFLFFVVIYSLTFLFFSTRK